MADRLIPAHAGKTHHEPGTPRSLTAHPRSRGENDAALAELTREAGSSPLTRGKRGMRRATHANHRLIPAHAGKTRGSRRMGRATPAHPRSRGENPNRSAQVAHITGSSPLTRGKPQEGGNLQTVLGLIPAHAGKTHRDGHLHGARGAHPRSRGENLSTYQACVGRAGSSPLTRGKLMAFMFMVWFVRLIPAHAGKTHSRSGGTSWSPAHPRSRGENRE